jgi:hypothetical protein
MVLILVCVFGIILPRRQEDFSAVGASIVVEIFSNNKLVVDDFNAKVENFLYRQGMKPLNSRDIDNNPNLIWEYYIIGDLNQVDVAGKVYYHFTGRCFIPKDQKAIFNCWSQDLDDLLSKFLKTLKISHYSLNKIVLGF